MHNVILDVLLGVVYLAWFRGGISMLNQETVVAASDNHASRQDDYSIRRATLDSLPIAFALVEEYFEEIDVLVRDTKEEFAAYIQSGDGGVWLALAGEQPIGCIVLHRLGSHAGIGEIKRLYIRASHRRNGLAERLLRALEQYAIQLSYEWLYLDTKDDLDQAIRFYQRQGYKRCGRYNSNPQATVFMRKRLANDSSVLAVPGIADSRYAGSTLLIRSFRSEDANDFRRLNEEWITRYFHLEEKDARTLNDPGKYILEPGGYIAMAFVEKDAVGCCALIRLDDTSFEVAKMAVTPSWQGRGLGRKLMEHVIAEARQLKAVRLYLETNSRLTPAIRLYESLGFGHLPADRITPSPYRRADVYMELLLE
jgi:putative acetyltransferase